MRDAASPAATSGLIGVQVVSEPMGALVSLEGEPLGETPVFVQLPRAKVQLTFSREGFEPQVRVVDLRDAKEGVPLAMETVRLPPSPAGSN